MVEGSNGPPPVPSSRGGLRLNSVKSDRISPSSLPAGVGSGYASSACSDPSQPPALVRNNSYSAPVGGSGSNLRMVGSTPERRRGGRSASISEEGGSGGGAGAAGGGPGGPVRSLSRKDSGLGSGVGARGEPCSPALLEQLSKVMWVRVWGAAGQGLGSCRSGFGELPVRVWGAACRGLGSWGSGFGELRLVA